MNSRQMASIVAGVLVFGASTPTIAQNGGVLQYGPNAIGVPVGGGIALLVLGGLLAAAAFWVIRRGGNVNRIATVATLAVAALVSWLSGAQIVHDAWANGGILLDNPSGGSVPVPEGQESYLNASGVTLRILSLTPPCPDAQNQALNACVPNATVLANGESCDTDFTCVLPEPEVCDGRDNDFDNLVDTADPDLTAPLEPCEGTWQCLGAGGWVCATACVPSCSGKVCGDDGCGGSCGTCPAGQLCSTDGTQCLTQPF